MKLLVCFLFFELQASYTIFWPPIMIHHAQKNLLLKGIRYKFKKFMQYHVNNCSTACILLVDININIQTLNFAFSLSFCALFVVISFFVFEFYDYNN
jgi:hypothetical protein